MNDKTCDLTVEFGSVVHFFADGNLMGTLTRNTNAARSGFVVGESIKLLVLDGQALSIPPNREH